MDACYMLYSFYNLSGHRKQAFNSSVYSQSCGESCPRPGSAPRKASSGQPPHGKKKNIDMDAGRVNEPVWLVALQQQTQTDNMPTHTTSGMRSEQIWPEDERMEVEEEEEWWRRKDEEVQDSPFAAAIRAWSCSASVGGCGQGPVPMATSGPPVALRQRKKKKRKRKARK